MPSARHSGFRKWVPGFGLQVSRAHDFRLIRRARRKSNGFSLVRRLLIPCTEGNVAHFGIRAAAAAASYALVVTACSAVSVNENGRNGDGNGGVTGATGGMPGSAGSGGSSTLCESTVAEAGSSSTVNARVPLKHRASPCCPSQRGPGPGTQPYPRGIAAMGADGSIACSSDSQCRSGTNGRCFPFEGLVGPGGCSYDECSTDSDCPSGMPCVCRSALSDNGANVCASGGNCAVDSNCGPGGYCSPSVDTCFGQSPYFCHTAFDTCIDDADCPPVNGDVANVTTAVCAYDPQAGHWACTQLVCYPP
jgi:hypothetical protein